MIGTTVGRYRITAKLGEGGMGVVYRAQHEALDSPAVIKVLREHLSQDQRVTGRFANEAKAASRIRHPGIVRIMDIGHLESGSLYILMEFLDGQSLAARLKQEQQLPESTAVSFIRQAARALGATHRENIIHRDLKPDNLFLVPDPDVIGGERVKLLDFGIAKLLEGGTGQRTQSDVIMGTPPYMSPEQCRSATEVDLRSDLYSLGVILFEMLCGRRPFRAVATHGYLTAHMTEAPPSVSEFNPAISPATAAVVAKLLAKDPDGRYPDTEVLIAALDQPSLSSSPQAATLPEAPQTSTSTDGTVDGRKADLRAAKTQLERRRQSDSGASPRDDVKGVPISTIKMPTTLQGVARKRESMTTHHGGWQRRVSVLAAVAVTATVAVVAVASGLLNDSGHLDPTGTAIRAAGNQTEQTTTAAGTEASTQAETATDDEAGDFGQHLKELGRACDRDDSTSCRALADAHERSDPALAAKLYRKACRLGHQPSCTAARGIVHVALAEVAPMRFVGLAAGTFTAGSPPDEPGRHHDESAHHVSVSGFQIAEAEVTQKQWALLMQKNPSDCSFACGDDMPVQAMTWYQAVEFANALSRREGWSPCYAMLGDRVHWRQEACDGYRLPTEAEWEYACRAGGQGGFAVGIEEDALKQYAHFGRGAHGQTGTIKSLKANAWGLYDMHGNVWEWTWDWYAPHGYRRKSNPRGPERGRAAPTSTTEGKVRTLRGGSFADGRSELRCANRDWDAPSQRVGSTGLRLVRNPAPNR